jgi:CHASE2 domain-containing sensor protein
MTRPGDIVTKGRAPISGGIAIACGILFVTAIVLAVIDVLSWFTAASSLLTFAITVLTWRRCQASDLKYRRRIERLDQRLAGEQ